jgi:pyrroloquinoline quinone biosynthesis protein B
MPRLTALVLGSAAGGGVPQWNCGCRICGLARAGDGRVQPRSQTSLAVSADLEHWVLLNAAPDLRAQILSCPALQPRSGTRGSPIAAVVLTGAEIDQTAGLLNLREGQPFSLCATAGTLAILDDNPMFSALRSDIVVRRPAETGKCFGLPGGIEAMLFSVPGKVPLYLEGDAAAVEDTVGVELRARGARLVFIPGAAAATDEMLERAAHADVVLLDGTLFEDEEMVRLGLGAKTGRRMGHLPMSGADGSLAAFANIKSRRIYIHLNNSNPVLIDDSPERRQVEAAGWEVAYDGMEIVL